MSLKGFETQKKVGTSVTQDFVTISKINGDKRGLDVAPKFAYALNLLPTLLGASTTTQLNIVAHGARVGDLVRMIGGLNDRIEVAIQRIIDVDNVEITSGVLNSDPVAGVDEAQIFRHITPVTDADGNMVFSPGPTTFTLDGVSTVVTEDTAVPANNTTLPIHNFFVRDTVQIPVTVDTALPANNRTFPTNLYVLDHISGDEVPVTLDNSVGGVNNVPIPVKLVDLGGGNINITAGDLNVHLDDTPLVNFDRTRIGDGSGAQATFIAEYVPVVGSWAMKTRDDILANASIEPNNPVPALAIMVGAEDETGDLQTLKQVGDDLQTSSLTRFTLDAASQIVIRDTVTPANSRPLPIISLNSNGTPATDNPVKFTRDGASQDVTRDTVVPGNNRGLPVDVLTLEESVETIGNAVPAQVVMIGVEDDSGDAQTLKVDAAGNLSTDQVKFLRDTVLTSVNRDTVVPANNRGLPVDVLTLEDSVETIGQPVPAQVVMIGVEDTTGDAQTLKVDAAGNLLTGGASFIRDTVLTPVNRDTVTPANNRGMPVDVLTLENSVEDIGSALPSQAVVIGAEDDTGDVQALLLNADREVLTASSLVYELDGTKTLVNQDTAVPANSRRLPVGLLNSAGLENSVTAPIHAILGDATDPITAAAIAAAQLTQATVVKALQTISTMMGWDGTDHREIAVDTAGAIRTRTSANGTSGSQDKGFLAASGTTVINPPLNAVGFILKCGAESEDNLYWEIGAAASTASVDFSGGQSTSYVPCVGSINLLAGAGGNVYYSIQWFIA